MHNLQNNSEVNNQETGISVGPMPSAMDNQWSSPKFITCPDCEERYDNGHKRRLIDTCGHPRCYSCLFADRSCPLCQKIPQDPKSRSSPLYTGGSGSDESLNTSGNSLTSGSLTKDQNSLSHPDLSEISKTRALTLPARGYRTDNYFRSLYRYDPHATENTDDKDCKHKPRKVINYHKSLENLSDEFWRSVERAASPLGRRAMSPSRGEDSPATSNKSSTDDVRSGYTNLSVATETRPRSSTEIGQSQKRNLQRAEALRKLEIAEGRPRSQSEYIISKRFPEGGRREVYNESATYTLPSNFHVMEPSERSRSASDRSSDISLPFSDSCSESSGDSDQLTVGNPHSLSYRGMTKRWSYEENQNERLRIAEERLYNGLRRGEEQARRTKAARNPLENVIHWVIEPPNHVQETHADNMHHRRPDPPRRGDSSKRISLQRGHEYNGQPPRLTKSSSSTAL